MLCFEFIIRPAPNENFIKTNSLDKKRKNQKTIIVKVG